MIDENTVFLRSLSFSSMEDRLHTIRRAHRQSCSWFFNTPKFQQWRDYSVLSGHNGLLCIKGKPGTGKSTLMKHILQNYQVSFKNHVAVAHFFNTRGGELDKTFPGMLRSLLFQLLQKEDSICTRFMSIFDKKRQNHGAGD